MLENNKKYILVGLVDARSMTRNEFRQRMKNASKNSWLSMNTSVKELLNNQTIHEEEGYLVQIGKTEHWFPKKDFEKMSILVQDNDSLPSEINVGQDMINDMVESYTTIRLGRKTVSVVGILRNGYEIIESTGCVDDRNVEVDVCQNICKERLNDKVKDYLGFLLQTAWHGIRK